MNATIAYTTSRQQPHFDWFISSLAPQIQSVESIRVLRIDLQCSRRTHEEFKTANGGMLIVSTCPPKPTVWQGEHRLTAVDFFDQANARNTALCLATHPTIAFVDDLSVLAPTWLQAVRECAAGGYIACGAYRKLNNMIVENGELKYCENHEAGKDPRWDQTRFTHLNRCPPQWSFGCSLAGPVEAFLKINGYPETLTAGLGYEDCLVGEALARNGYELRYDRRMLTYESEEDHHNQPVLLRIDPGVSPNDKSHRILELARDCKWFDNDFGDGCPSLRSLRNHVQRGGPFPIRKKPQHEWFTGMPLSEFHKYKP